MQPSRSPIREGYHYLKVLLAALAPELVLGHELHPRCQQPLAYRENSVWIGRSFGSYRRLRMTTLLILARSDTKDPTSFLMAAYATHRRPG
jgi:hypothetical protein